MLIGAISIILIYSGMVAGLNWINRDDDIMASLPPNAKPVVSQIEQRSERGNLRGIQPWMKSPFSIN